MCSGQLPDDATSRRANDDAVRLLRCSAARQGTRRRP